MMSKLTVSALALATLLLAAPATAQQRERDEAFTDPQRLEGAEDDWRIHEREREERLQVRDDDGAIDRDRDWRVDVRDRDLTREQRRELRDRDRLYRIEGVVQDTSDITVPGSDQSHVFVRIRTEDGDTVLTDLGPANRIQQINLRQGDRIIVEGNRDTSGDQPLLVATRVDANEQSVKITRSTDVRTIAGRVADTRVITPRGSNEPHQAILVDTGDRDYVIVDLGPQDSIRGLQIQSGFNVNVQGRDVRFGDRVVLYADRLDVGGQEYVITRQPRTVTQYHVWPDVEERSDERENITLQERRRPDMRP